MLLLFDRAKSYVATVIKADHSATTIADLDPKGARFTTEGAHSRPWRSFRTPVVFVAGVKSTAVEFF